MLYVNGKYIKNGAKNTKTPCVKNKLVRGYMALNLHKTRG